MEEFREAAGEEDGPATEMSHFAVHSPRPAYGVPRWIGTLLSVLGSRQMEEVNYLYFSNKSVPPLAILISGGRLSKSSIPRIEDFIENHIKGKKNFHKCLILEAETSPNPNIQHSGEAQIKLEPLTPGAASRGASQQVRRAEHGQGRGFLQAASAASRGEQGLQPRLLL